MASDFQFVCDNGRIYYVCAESRKEAIRLFCEELGVSLEFVKQHCVVRNMGRVKRAYERQAD